jgi:aspartyl-tRNA(Asn)/glutamyl-tRNA(Gln) amidotransferase subunit A
MTVSLRELGVAFRNGSLSPEIHTRNCLDAIATANPRLGCFFSIMAGAALAEATKAAADFAAGIDRGPLQGIPYTVADVIDVDGFQTTCGSRLMADHVANTTADVVKRLRSSGAVLLGKSAVFEFGVGSPGADSLFPAARNPWNAARTAGAVGGGGAVAAGLCAFAIAPDTGGAVRGSAALCGTAGLKPTRNAVSCEGVFPAAPSLDHVGIIAASADDIGFVMPVVAQGYQPRPCTSDLDGLRVGVLSGLPAIHPAMEQALHRAASAFAALGAQTRQISISYLERLLVAGRVIYASECFAIHRDALRSDPDRFGRGTRHRIIMGAFLDRGDDAQARELADGLTRRFDDEVMSSCDILLSPAAAGPAGPLENSEYGAAGRSGAQTLLFNITGHPAISIPYNSCEGLPLGLQLAARRSDDGLLLAAAGALARVGSTSQGISA